MKMSSLVTATTKNSHGLIGITKTNKCGGKIGCCKMVITAFIR